MYKDDCLSAVATGAMPDSLAVTGGDPFLAVLPLIALFLVLGGVALLQLGNKKQQRGTAAATFGALAVMTLMSGFVVAGGTPTYAATAPTPCIGSTEGIVAPGGNEDNGLGQIGGDTGGGDTCIVTGRLTARDLQLQLDRQYPWGLTYEVTPAELIAEQSGTITVTASTTARVGIAAFGATMNPNPSSLDLEESYPEDVQSIENSGTIDLAPRIMDLLERATQQAREQWPEAGIFPSSATATTSVEIVITLTDSCGETYTVGLTNQIQQEESYPL